MSNKNMSNSNSILGMWEDEYGVIFSGSTGFSVS